MSVARHRRAFTLVELLVVTGMIAVLFGLVASGLRPTEDSDLRTATQAIVSSLLQTQTQALQNPAAGGLVLNTTVVPLASGSATVATGLSFAAQPPAILVTATSLVVSTGAALADISSLAASAVLSGSQASVAFQAPDNADGVGDGYRIRFAAAPTGAATASGFGPWFAFEPALSGANAGIVRFLPENGQVVSNTTWPVAFLPMRLRCEIMRRPEATQPAASFAKSVAMDMRYSGIGDDPYASFQPPGGALGNVVLQFSSTGGIEAIIPAANSGKSSLGVSRVSSAPIYLFVTPRSLIDANGSGLLTDKSTWVCISPHTGRVVAGKNVAQSGAPPTLASSGGKEAYTAAYRAYFQAARRQVRRVADAPR